VRKVNIHTPAGLDSFIHHLADCAPVILADMGAGSGQVPYHWFEKRYLDVAEVGIVLTTIGVITSDPASVESVLAWAEHDNEQAKQLRSVSPRGCGLGAGAYCFVSHSASLATQGADHGQRFYASVICSRSATGKLAKTSARGK
jgi:hypothetical protein